MILLFRNGAEQNYLLYALSSFNSWLEYIKSIWNLEICCSVSFSIMFSSLNFQAQPNSLAFSERDINDFLLFSPDQTKNNADNGLNDETPRRDPINPTALFNHSVTVESSSGNSHPPVCSPAATKANHKIHKVADLSALRVPPAIDNASTDTTNEKLNL